MAIIHGILFVCFLIAAVLLIILVLFRPSEQGGGLGGVFGGGASDMTFGVKTTKVIDKIIIVLATIFILFSILSTLTSDAFINKPTSDTTEETSN